MKIALDIDGVLADFVTPFLQLLEQRVGGPSIDPASITDPNFQHHPFLTKELIYDCMVDTSYDAEFWRVLAPLPSHGPVASAQPGEPRQRSGLHHPPLGARHL